MYVFCMFSFDIENLKSEYSVVKQQGSIEFAQITSSLMKNLMI